MSRVSTSRKGVAPLAIVAFLVVIVGAVIFIAYLWETAVVRVANAIQIQHVLFKPEEFIVYVQNVGEGPVTVVNVYIDDEQFNVNNGNCIVGQSNTNIIPKGSTAEVTIAKMYTQKIHVQVVCSDGTGIESDYKPPLE